MNIEEMSVNAIRVLSADAIQKANSGHPGLPLGTAPVAYELFAKHMNYNPHNPDWVNRDRFVLSGGHGSMLLYSLFHLFGIGNLSLEEVKNFRQFGSLTPGHPEYGHTVGVEATTGPLGQGMAMAVGMAMAEAHLSSVFNKEGFPVVDHYTYVLGGDGCMMEGISSECFSLAGTLGLSKLIVFYDSNNISIEGSTDIAFTEDVVTRFKAFGFQTIEVEDGNDLEAIGKAIEEAKADKTRPSLIKVNTLIGYGCPAKQGKASAHGEPLGVDNVAALKENINWPCKGDFEVPKEVYDHYKELADNMAKAEDKWNELFAAYVEKYPEMKELWDNYFDGYDMSDLFNSDEYWAKGDKPEATRSTSGTILNMIKKAMPNLIGGSADLAPSNKTNMKNAGDFSKDNYAGTNLHFGVREHRPHVPPGRAGGGEPQPRPLFLCARNGAHPLREGCRRPRCGGVRGGHGLLRRPRGRQRQSQRVASGRHTGPAGAAGGGAERPEPDAGRRAERARKLPHPQPHRRHPAEQLYGTDARSAGSDAGKRDGSAGAGLSAETPGGRHRFPPSGPLHGGGSGKFTAEAGPSGRRGRGAHQLAPPAGPLRKGAARPAGAAGDASGPRPHRRGAGRGVLLYLRRDAGSLPGRRGRGGLFQPPPRHGSAGKHRRAVSARRLPGTSRKRIE